MILAVELICARATDARRAISLVVASALIAVVGVFIGVVVVPKHAHRRPAIPTTAAAQARAYSLSIASRWAVASVTALCRLEIRQRVW
jgi:hypothetical protein